VGTSIWHILLLLPLNRKWPQSLSSQETANSSKIVYNLT
jgi:hypothetical protein